jgi:hypothetical protein
MVHYYVHKSPPLVPAVWNDYVVKVLFLYSVQGIYCKDNFTIIIIDQEHIIPTAPKIAILNLNMVTFIAQIVGLYIYCNVKLCTIQKL